MRSLRFAFGLVLGAGTGATFGCTLVSNFEGLTETATAGSGSGPTSGGGGEACDGTVNPDNGHCYRFVDVRLSWNSAESDCVTWGGHLVSITGALEEAFVNTTFIEPILDDPDGGTDKGIWLGANDIAVFKKWVWTNGDPFGYNDWAVNQPNDTTHTKNCVFLMAAFHTWNDYDCGIAGTYVCERPAKLP